MLNTRSFLLVLFSFIALTASAQSTEYYTLKIYHLKSAAQEARLDSFLKDAYVPAMHRSGMKQVGVFKPRVPSSDTTRLVYVFLTNSTVEAATSPDKKLVNDSRYTDAARRYVDAAYNDIAYERLETIILSSFPGSKLFAPPLKGPKKDRVYELRSYESHSEKAHQNKVDMFTKGDELGLFHRLGFNAVFYGQVLAGSRMPNLMYMTSFEDTTSRQQHWEAFGKDPQWKILSAEKQYQQNVSKIDMFMLYPTEYSDL